MFNGDFARARATPAQIRGGRSVARRRVSRRRSRSPSPVSCFARSRSPVPGTRQLLRAVALASTGHASAASRGRALGNPCVRQAAVRSACKLGFQGSRNVRLSAPTQLGIINTARAPESAKHLHLEIARRPGCLAAAEASKRTALFAAAAQTGKSHRNTFVEVRARPRLGFGGRLRRNQYRRQHE